MRRAAVFLKAAPTAATATPDQLRAGNYRKHHIRFQGLDISIENPAGSIRSGRDPGGHEWRVQMRHHYGYIRGSLGVDGDHVDCYVGPDSEADTAYIVHQRKAGKWNEFDEDKVMLGFLSEEAARAAYLAHYDDPRFLGPITAMPMEEFKGKVRATAGRPGMLKGAVVFSRHITIAELREAGAKARASLPMVCLDFDGVLHSYVSGWQGSTVIQDGPVPGAKEAVDLLRYRYRVVVNSARCDTAEGRQAIADWLASNGIQVDDVVEHKPPAVAYVDDLAVPFQGDWAAVMSRIARIGSACEGLRAAQTQASAS